MLIVSRMIYVNIDSPNLGFIYLNFLGEAQWKKSPCMFILQEYDITAEGRGPGS